MTVTVAHIWRHPVKSHGREALDRVTLEVGATVPWDRTWAVAHEGARIDADIWSPCANFSRGAKAPQLMAIETSLDEMSELLTMRHPARPEITLHPERDEDAMIEWVKPLMPENRAQSARVVRVAGHGMTDTDFPSISIASLASHASVEAALEHSIQPERWRANIWLDGLAAWEEVNWVGRTVTIGDVEFDIRQQITRCLATTANTSTGERDADTLGALKGFGHQEFGIYGVVTKGGSFALGDKASVA